MYGTCCVNPYAGCLLCSLVGLRVESDWIILHAVKGVSSSLPYRHLSSEGGREGGMEIGHLEDFYFGIRTFVCTSRHV